MSVFILIMNYSQVALLSSFFQAIKTMNNNPNKKKKKKHGKKCHEKTGVGYKKASFNFYP